MAERNSESKIVNVCGLWKNKSKSGKTYLSGTIGNIKIMVFPVDEKRSEKSPDYSLCIAPVERDANGGGSRRRDEDDEDDAPRGRSASSGRRRDEDDGDDAPRKSSKKAPADDVDDDDIPF